MINPYEKMLMIMREQGSVTDAPFSMGCMSSGGKLQIGDLVLTSDDYYKLNNVSLQSGDNVLIAIVDDSYIVLGKVV